MINFDKTAKARDCLQNATDLLLLAISQPHDSFWTNRRYDEAIENVKDGLKFLDLKLDETE